MSKKENAPKSDVINKIYQQSCATKIIKVDRRILFQFDYSDLVDEERWNTKLIFRTKTKGW